MSLVPPLLPSELSTPELARERPLPEVPITDVLPPGVRERVTIAPPPDWVTVREVDSGYRVETGAPYTMLLLDTQQHATRHATYTREVKRLETMKAVQEAAQWRLDSFDPSTQRVAIHSLAIVRGDKRMEYAQTKRLRFLQRETNLEQSAIHGYVTVMVILDDVRVGDVLDASFTVESTPRLLPERSWLLQSVPTQLPLRAYRIAVRFAAADLERMQWKGSVDFGSPVVREVEGEIEWSWSLDRLRPREPEPRVAPWHITWPWIQVTDCQSWATVVEGLLAAWKECFADEELLASAREIAGAAATPLERVTRALALVQDDIRYLSLEVGLGGQVPSAPGVILQRRFGDCKDKAFLVAHLLRCLSVPARPVLVNTNLRHNVEQFLPMPGAFNHAIVEFEIDGQRRCVDATQPLQGGSALDRPVFDFGLCLPISAGATGLEKLPPSPAKGFHHLREVFRFDTTGRPTLLRVTVTAGGREADRLRQSVGIEGAEAVARWREEMYRQEFPEARRLDAMDCRDDRARNVFTLTESYELPHAVIAMQDGTGFGFRHHSRLIQSFLVCPDTLKRRYPLGLPPPSDVEHWIEMEAPSLLRGETQTAVKRDSIFRFACEYKRLFGRWTAHLRLRTFADEVPPQHFEQFKAKVAEILPLTQVVISLPAGIAAPKGKRRGLPGSGTRATETMNEPQAPAPETEARHAPETAIGTLSAEPAPALSSASPSAPQVRTGHFTTPRLSQEEQPRAAAAFSASEADRKPEETEAPPEPVRQVEHDPQSRRRRSRKRSQRGRWKRWAIGVGLLIFAAATAILWVLITHKAH